MTVKIEEAARRQMAQFLPDALARAITSYNRFIEQPIEKEAGTIKTKSFSEHHVACKAAIAHMELLLKLARLADLPDVEAKDHNNQIMIAAMMQEASDKLAEYRAQYGEADDS